MSQVLAPFKIKILQREYTNTEQCLWSQETGREHLLAVVLLRVSCLSGVAGVTARLPHTYRELPDVVVSSYKQYPQLGKSFPATLPVGRLLVLFCMRGMVHEYLPHKIPT